MLACKASKLNVKMRQTAILLGFSVGENVWADAVCYLEQCRSRSRATKWIVRVSMSQKVYFKGFVFFEEIPVWLMI